MKVQLKRVYEEPLPTDGFRVLVDRLWPRGVRKEALAPDAWAKDLAPSRELRRWFHEDKEARWEAFAAMYRKELSENPALSAFLRTVAPYETVTLLYAAGDARHNHACVLRDVLNERRASLA